MAPPPPAAETTIELNVDLVFSFFPVQTREGDQERERGGDTVKGGLCGYSTSHFASALLILLLQLKRCDETTTAPS